MIGQYNLDNNMTTNWNLNVCGIKNLIRTGSSSNYQPCDLQNIRSTAWANKFNKCA